MFLLFSILSTACNICFYVHWCHCIFIYSISHKNAHPRSVWYPPKATSSLVDVVGCDIGNPPKATSNLVDDVVGCDIGSY